MKRPLHRLLLLLALVDLALVQATGIVAVSGLVPLWALALLSPFLRQLQRFSIYRVLWNGSVIALFALLALDAQSTGMASLLEDGLLLAILCQVHLLNNVGRRQQPDLLFLNSLLIAFVTAFFSNTGNWLGLFVLHGLAFVPALFAWAGVSARCGGSRMAPLPFGGGLLRSLAVLAVATAVFVGWPRDFDRPGWLGGSMAGFDRAGRLPDRIALGDETAAVLDDTVILRIESPSGVPVPSHWRCATYTRFGSGEWRPPDLVSSTAHTDPPWRRGTDRVWRRLSEDGGPTFRVELVDLGRWWHALPLPPSSWKLAVEGGDGLLVDEHPDGTMAVARPPGAGSGPVRYAVRTSTRSLVGSADRTTRLALTEAPIEAACVLAERLARALLGRDRLTPLEAALRFADWLRANRLYALPGRAGFAANFTAFLDGRGGGHCEFFASALALMLRRTGIPCRVVGGYLAHERDENGTILVRSRHAHAWVEVLLPNGRWATVDPTPSAATAAESAGRDVASWLENLTVAVALFDEGDRADLLGCLADAPGKAARLATEHPLWSVSFLAPFAFWFLLRLRSGRRHPAVASLLRASRSAGLSLRPGETPRELAARARRCSGITPDRLHVLESAVDRHERLRYGGHEKLQS